MGFSTKIEKERQERYWDKVERAGDIKEALDSIKEARELRETLASRSPEPMYDGFHAAKHSGALADPVLSLTAAALLIGDMFTRPSRR